MNIERIGIQEVIETEDSFSFRLAPSQWYLLLAVLAVVSISGGLICYYQLFVSTEPPTGMMGRLAPIGLILSPILLIWGCWYAATGNPWSVIDRKSNEYRRGKKLLSRYDQIQLIAQEQIGNGFFVGLSDGQKIIGHKASFRKEDHALAFKGKLEAFINNKAPRQ